MCKTTSHCDANKWIATSLTAAPRNDLLGNKYRHCDPEPCEGEAIQYNVYVVKSDMRRKVVVWLESLELSSIVVQMYNQYAIFSTEWEKMKCPR